VIAGVEREGGCERTLSFVIVLSSWVVERVCEARRSVRDCSSWARRASCWMAWDALAVVRRDYEKKRKDTMSMYYFE
jgi:hypothetical protein